MICKRQAGRRGSGMEMLAWWLLKGGKREEALGNISHLHIWMQQMVPHLSYLLLPLRPKKTALPPVLPKSHWSLDHMTFLSRERARNCMQTHTFTSLLSVHFIQAPVWSWASSFAFLSLNILLIKKWLRVALKINHRTKEWCHKLLSALPMISIICEYLMNHKKCYWSKIVFDFLKSGVCSTK